MKNGVSESSQYRDVMKGEAEVLHDAFNLRLRGDSASSAADQNPEGRRGRLLRRVQFGEFVVRKVAGVT